MAEARLAAKRAARAEAREIRMKELERQQKEVEERPEKDFAEKVSRTLPGLSTATLSSLGGGMSRRNSGDTCTSVDTEASLREMRDSLAEAEEKYKKAMVSNAQLDNEKTNFMYQVDTLKDMLLELEEQLAESQRQYEEKSKELEREKHAHSVLQFQFAEVKEALTQREQMLEKHGIILNSETATNGETSHTLADASHPGPASSTTEGLDATPALGDGALGRASEVPWTHGAVVQVGQKETSPRTESDQPTEDSGKAGPATKASPPSEDNGKGQSAPEDRASVSESSESLPEHAAQAASGAGPGEPQESPYRARAEDPEHGDSAGLSPSNSLECSCNSVDPEEGQVATDDQRPSLAHVPKKESTESTAMKEPVQGTQVGGDNDKEGGQDAEKPSQTQVQIMSDVPVAALGMGEANSEPSEMSEAKKEKQGPQGESPDPSQRKTKNKKKKNKKKKAPGPVDNSPVIEEDTRSSTKEEEPPVEGSGQKTVSQEQDEGTHMPPLPPEVVTGDGEHPEHSRTEGGEEQQQKDEAGDAPVTPGTVVGDAVRERGAPGTPKEEEEASSEGAQGSPPGSPAPPSSWAGEGTEQLSVKDGISACAEEPVNSCPETPNDRVSDDKGKGKEDCALS